ncbi:DedA family protein [Jannaschia sp. Os4]|uniref:DedA family protein n=1 Tax=Jannaschia sp. Os4 TaxID=2807617 RepID=UPI00193AB6BC|nr:DedA family protein [Jannaschia sp. Os4]MBM2576998.1 DedA family protein [Jannaschia sp. Os4]
MVDTLVSFLAANPGWAFAVAALCAMLETLFFVSALVPATAVLLAAGGLSAVGGVSLLPLVLGGWAGSIVGSTASWAVGRWAEPWIKARPRLKRLLGGERLKRRVRNWGAPFVALSHVLGAFRAPAFVVAGMARMEWWRFVPATMLGAVAWAVLVPYAGAAGGTALDFVFSR